MKKTRKTRINYGLLAIIVFLAAFVLPQLLSALVYLVSDAMGNPYTFFDTRQNELYVAAAELEIAIMGLIYRKMKHKRPPVVRLPLWKEGALTLLFAGGMSGLSMAWLILCEEVLVKFPIIKQSIDGFTQNMDNIEQGSYFWLFVAVVIVGPFVEELVFRGVLFNALEGAFQKTAVAIVLSGIAFGVWHGNIIQGVYTACMGLLLGYIYSKTRNLRLVTGIHMVNNLISTLPPALYGSTFEYGLNLLCLLLILPAFLLLRRPFRQRA